MGKSWTGEQTNQLRQRWADGWSGGAIAEELGMSRNSVMSRICRLGLQKGLRTKNTKAAVRQPRKRKIYPRPSVSHTGAFRLNVAKFMADIGVEVDLPPALPPITAVFFHELEPHHCRFSYGDSPNMLFCGAARLEPHSYCAAHCRIAYRPPTRRDAPPRTDHPWKDKGIAA